MRLSVHQHSIEAYYAEQPKLSKRAAAILEWIYKHGPKTDREVAYGMGFGENLNAVRPRLTELIEANKLMEVTSRKCEITGKTVRVVDVRRARQGSLL